MNMNPDDFREWLRRLLKELEKLGIEIAKSSWKVETLTEHTHEVLDEDERQNDPDDNVSNPAGGTARGSNARYVTTGVNHVIIEHDADGKMVAHIDNIGLPIKLGAGKRLRQLLVALCGKESRANAPDGDLVPFKTSAELIAAIKNLGGTSISKGNLQNLVQSLRELFIKARISPHLIETGGDGYRLRINMNGGVHENRR